ncbi:hypothetical protein OEB99_13125 [Actinotalea sp. M2MS4P-6]|uniref:hypothetical protein n=1 Tax=Actinotalea sp. M2MS4P-6 TaxID=2983762 RepID=UPI0021E3EA61|nr:hypothetical protein [Actinotalea sp. M2MS4P-6]MCV2395254.1 hypothetical protein [Actinotalea sp. M2MS4P-6]
MLISPRRRAEMFLLVTVGGVALGVAYAGFIGGRFGPQDWRRWAALMPVWVLAIGIAVALHAVNMTDLLPQAVQAFAIGSFFQALIDSWRTLRHRRAGAVVRDHATAD